MAMASDTSFGPGTGASFDFTLLFDHAILSIIPSALMILLAPVFILHYRRQTEVILASALLWNKIACSMLLLGVQVGSLVLWSISQEHRTAASISAASLACAATLLLALLLNFEHRFSTSSSAFMSVWLVASLLCDGAIARSCYLRPGLQSVGSLLVAAAVLKVILTVLEEWPKTNFVKDSNTGKPVARESTGGFWNRTLILWLNKTLYSGYRFVINMDDLDDLDAELKSSTIAATFQEHWEKANKQSRFVLAKTCLRVSLWPFLSIIPPRLAYSFFMFVQPFYLDAAVSTFGEASVSSQRKGALLGAAAFIYLGVTITRSVFKRMEIRLATIVRGLTVGAIYTNALNLAHNHKELSSAVTLMSTDIDGITDGVRAINETWINYLEVGFGIYLLATLVGKAAFLVALPLLVTTWLSRFLGQRVPDARAEWNRRIETRVSKTSKMLSHLKSLKMVGLDQITSDQIRDQRKSEIEASVKSRMLMVATAIGISLCNVLTPTVVLAGALFWTTFTGTLTPVEGFKTLAVIFLVADPMEHSLRSWTSMLSTMGCIERIQSFLLLSGRTDPRLTGLSANGSSLVNEKRMARVFENTTHTISTRAEDLPPTYVVKFSDVQLAPLGKQDTIVLRDINLSVKEGEFIVVSGQTGSGKSVFMEAMLGDAEIVSGSLTVKPGRKGWCGQAIWIQNGSIKDNIVGHSPLDDAWYETVVNGCQLRRDFERMPLGDKSPVGSNGSNLSGGQKQRVAIARALFSRPEMLLFDDSFSSLDRDTMLKLFEAVFGSGGLIEQWNPTVILVTHCLDLFYRADRVVLLESKAAAIHDDLDDTYVRAQLVNAVAERNGELQHLELDEFGSPKKLLKTNAMVPTGEEAEETVVRQRGDLKLYLFFLKTIGMAKACFWLVFTAFAMFIEKFPEVFLRIWLDNAPERKVYFLGYVLITYTSTLTSCGQIYFWHRHAMPTSLEVMHELLLDALMRAKLSFLGKTDNGVLLNHFSQDMTLVSQTFPQMFMRTVASLFYMLMGLMIILTATRYTPAVIPPLFVVLYLIQHYYLRTSRQIRYLDLESKTPIYTQLTEITSGLQYIRAFGWEKDMLDHGLELLDTSQRPYYQMFTIQRWLGVVMDLIVFFLALVILGVSLNLTFTATEASLALGLVTLLKFSDDLAAIVLDWTMLETSVGALARIRGFIETTPKEENPVGEVAENWPASGHITMRDVVASYGQDQTDRSVLDGISFDVPRGRKVGIVGRSGSGKSSLLLTALNFLDYTGSITIDGVDISTIPLQLLRTRITTICQDLIDLEGSVFDNLCLWDGSYLEEQHHGQRKMACADILRDLGLWEKVGAAKDGLDTQVSKVGFSRGEKQLLGIARSILKTVATKTKVVFVDEATSNLDDDAEKKVHEAIHKMLANCTVLIVSHRPAMLEGVDFTLELENGKIVSDVRFHQTSDVPWGEAPQSKRQLGGGGLLKVVNPRVTASKV